MAPESVLSHRHEGKGASALPDPAMPADLRQWLSLHLPGLCAVEDVSWPRADSRVWRVTDTTATAYVKISPSQQSYTRETRAYRYAADALGPGKAPRLLAADPDLRAILTSPLRGVVVRTANLPAADEIHAHELAGQLLARWHDHRPDTAGAAVLAAVQAQVDLAAERAARTADVLATPHRVLVEHALRDLPALALSVPLACTHGDFSPRNWMWDHDTASLSLLDFEKAGTGLVVEDFVWLAATTWPHHPHLQHAILTGYGRDLDPDEYRTLTLLTTLAALSYLDAGMSLRDPALTAKANNTFRQLTSPEQPRRG